MVNEWAKMRKKEKKKGCSLGCWQVSRHKSITGAFIYLSYELILQTAKLQKEKLSQWIVFPFLLQGRDATLAKTTTAKTSSGVMVAVFEQSLCVYVCGDDDDDHLHERQ